MATSSKVTQACHDGDSLFHDQLLSQDPKFIHPPTHTLLTAPRHFLISEEIPGPGVIDVNTLLMVPLITLSTHSTRQVDRQMISMLWAWHTGKDYLLQGNSPRMSQIMPPRHNQGCGLTF